MTLNSNAKIADTNSDLLLIGNKTITTSQTILAVSTSNNEARQFVRIFNKGTNKIYIGVSGVTTTNGEPLEKNQNITIAITSSLSLYAITASGTSDVIIWELG
jgi:type V secretory pathway adhesin AidA